MTSKLKVSVNISNDADESNVLLGMVIDYALKDELGFGLVCSLVEHMTPCTVYVTKQTTFP